MTAPLLSVRDLTVQFKTDEGLITTVDNVSFDIAAGEVLGLVGESGSGKSVTAKSLMKLNPGNTVYGPESRITLNLDEGPVDVLSLKSASELNVVRGGAISMIFQEPMASFAPAITIGEQMVEQLLLHTSMNRAQARELSIEMLDRVGISDAGKRIDQYAFEFSGGMRQRAMIAMALSTQPKLLIADEPTTALDVTTQAQILDLIKDIQRRHGTGVLFITHDFGVVAEIADRIVVMQKGRVVEQGTRDEILLNPQHPYTKMLIGSVPSMEPSHRAVIDKTSPALIAQRVNKTYGGFGLFRKSREVHANRDVSLVVHRRETLGVVGESGSGKSTLARCIVRLQDPTSGHIEVDGVDIARISESAMRPHRRDIQIIFQDPYRSLNPRRTVGQSIVEGPMNFGVSAAEAEARAKELMEIVGLSAEALDRFPHQFSGGQRQRICIARALAMQPKVLIADEAVSALDVSVQAQVLNLLDDVRERYDLAMLFITHDLRVAAQICDRIMVMQNGVVVEEGETAEVYANPQHEYTRTLLAAAPGRDVAFAK